jgi:hypothetical protein
MDRATRYIELALLVVLICTYGFTSYQKNVIWKNEMSLWSDVVKKSPQKADRTVFSGSHIRLTDRLTGR